MKKGLSESVESYAKLQLAVGYLGEKEQAGWWDTNFLSSVGQQMLAMAFPRSALSAGCTSAKEAARRLHDSRIGVGGVFHLFRLPPDIEERVHHYILNASSGDFEPWIKDKDTALALLEELAGGAKSTDSEGPTRIADADSIHAKSTIKKTAKSYLEAFRQNKQCFPYFQGQ